MPRLVWVIACFQRLARAPINESGFTKHHIRQRFRPIFPETFLRLPATTVAQHQEAWRLDATFLST